MNLQQLIHQAKPGATIDIPAGTYPGPLEIKKPITLKGAGAAKTVLDAKGQGACVLVNDASAEVTLIGLTLANGSSPAGGAISYLDGKRLQVEDCVLEGSTCKQYGGGGAFLLGPSALFTRVRFHRNMGTQGGAVLVDAECTAELRGCLITGNAAQLGGALCIREAAKVTLVHCTIGDNTGLGKAPAGPELLIGGTMSRTPELRLINSIVFPKQPTTNAVQQLGKFKGNVTVAHSLLPDADRSVLQGEGLRFGPPDFFPSGNHRQKLGPSSPAAATADPRRTPAGLKDFLGKALSREADADMGAYAAF